MQYYVACAILYNTAPMTAYVTRRYSMTSTRNIIRLGRANRPRGTVIPALILTVFGGTLVAWPFYDNDYYHHYDYQYGCCY